METKMNWQQWSFIDLSELEDPISTLKEDFPDLSIEIEFNEEMRVFIRVQLFEDSFQSTSLYECVSFIRKLVGDMEMRKTGYLVLKNEK